MIIVKKLQPTEYMDFAAFLAERPTDTAIGTVVELLGGGKAQRLLRGDPHTVIQAAAQDGWAATLSAFQPAEVVVLSRVLDGMEPEAAKTLLDTAISCAQRLVVVRMGQAATADILPEGFVTLTAYAPADGEVAIAFAWIEPDGSLRRLQPHFSIMMPVYNHRQYIDGAIDSVRAQDYPHWSACVVDDGSTDGTGEHLQTTLAGDDRFTLIRKQNGGTATALNAAMQAARNEWIGWLSSDDAFLPNKLAAHAAAIVKDNGAAKFHHTANHLLIETEQRQQPVAYQPAVVQGSRVARLVAMANLNYVNGITTVVHRDLYTEVGGFNPRYRFTQDYLMWTTLMRRSNPVFLPLSSAITRLGPNRTTVKYAAINRLEAITVMLEYLNALTPEDFCRGDPRPPREVLLDAAAAMYVSAFSPNSFFAGYGLQWMFLEKTIGLIQNICVYSSDLAPLKQRIESWAAGQVCNMDGERGWHYILDAVTAGRNPKPIDPQVIVRNLLANAKIQQELRDAVPAFESYFRAA